MSLVTANGVNVLHASILMPLYGLWTADLVLDQPDGTGFDAGTKVSIACNGGLTFNGVVVPDRTGDYLDSVHVRVIAGAGGMTKPATVKGYAQPGAYVRDVLNQLATDSGETLSSDIAQSLLQTNLTAWATLKGTVSAALVSLIEIVVPDANWRMTPDGKLLVVEETWPASNEAYELIANNPSERSFDLGVDTFTIVPGVNLSGVGTVNRVEHYYTESGLRSHVMTQIADEDRGTGAAIQALARQMTAKLDFYALYDAKVAAQSADGATVDLIPSDKRIPQLQRVPLVLGTPGTVVKFVPGSFVRLGWNNGNPEQPYACLFQGGETVTSISFAGNSVPFVQGASKELGVLTLTVGGSATLAWTYKDANGVTTTGASGAPITLTGKGAQIVTVG